MTFGAMFLSQSAAWALIFSLIARPRHSNSLALRSVAMVEPA